MTDVNDFCDKTYKQLVGLKAGLYDVLIKSETAPGDVPEDTIAQLKGMIAGIESGVEELRNQCPSDWSPNKKEIEDKMEELSKVLNNMASKMGTVVPDSMAWT